MSAMQLAQQINEANVSRNIEKKIVAEHFLNVRLARLQARPVWWSIFAAIIGAFGGAFLTAWLTKTDSQVQCICEYKNVGQENQ